MNRLIKIELLTVLGGKRLVVRWGGGARRGSEELSVGSHDEFMLFAYFLRPSCIAGCVN